MTANRAMFPIQTMCKAFGVSRAGCYAWLDREPSARARADAELTTRIEAIHKASRQTYGAPRIHAELIDEGVHVGRKRVEPVVVAKHGRPVVVVMAAEDFERLKARDAVAPNLAAKRKARQ